MRKTIAVLTAAGMMIPLAAHAVNGRGWLMVGGGGGMYAMADLNAEIDAINAAYAGTGWSFRRVEQGRLFGGAMGFETAGQWNFGLGFDRLDAGTQASDGNGALEYRFGANAWRAFAEYALKPIGRSAFFFGGVIGILQESGKQIESATGSAPVEYKIHGTGPLFEGHVGGNWWATPTFAVTATVGYRYATVNEVKVENPSSVSNREVPSLDFSGPCARVGIKVATKRLSE